jgi:hypothetical protein
VDIYEQNGTVQSVSTPRKLTVVAGSQYKADFTVLAG